MINPFFAVLGLILTDGNFGHRLVGCSKAHWLPYHCSASWQQGRSCGVAGTSPEAL